MPTSSSVYPRARSKPKPVTSPAFQFYPADWLSSTRRLPLAARGAHIDLLATSWTDGPLPTDTAELAAIVGVTERVFLPLWSVLKTRWKVTRRGIVNVRLERVRADLLRFREKQAVKGRKSAQQRFNRGSTVVQPMAVEPEPNPSVFDLRSSSSSSSLDQEHTRVSDVLDPEPEIPISAVAPVWKKPEGRSASLVTSHRSCRPEVSIACGRGVCVPPFMADQWIAQAGGEYVTKFANRTIANAPHGPLGEPLKFWRAAWDAEHPTASPQKLTRNQESILSGARVTAYLEGRGK